MDTASVREVSIIIPAFLIGAGIVFYTAVQSAVVGITRRPRMPLYFAFAGACLCAALYQVATAAYYTAESTAAAAVALHWQVASGCLFFPIFFLFVAHYTGQRRIAPWLISVSALFALLLLINAALPYSLRFSTLEPDGMLRLPWGERLAMFKGEPGGWNGLIRLAVLAVFIWAAARSVIQHRRGERRAAWFLLAYLAIQFASFLYGGLIDWGVIRSVYPAGFAFLSLAILMSMSLGLEIQDHADSLERAGRELRREIERRSDAEEALHESEQRLRKQSEVLVRLVTSTALESGDLKTVLSEITTAAADTLEIERVNVWIYDENRSMIQCLEMFERSTGVHSDGQTLKAKDYPAYFKALEEGRTIAADDAFSDPRTKEFSDNYLSVHAITSMLDAPIRIGGRMAGVICHEHIGPPRHWTVEEQNFAGSLADVAALAIDSHERRRAEAALRDSEERFRRLSEGPFEGIAITDGGIFLDVNEQLSRIFGYTHAELIGMPVLQCVAPESRELVMGRIQAADETPYEHLALRKDGSVFPVEVYGRRIPYNGRTVRVTAIRDITERKRVEESLRHAAEEVRLLKDRLEAEKIYLEDEIKIEHNFEEIIGVSPNFVSILHQVEQVASTDSTVLILGETGTGKELIARAIHNISPRAHRTLVKVNCAALPEHLIESELFGHEKGAFTGAHSRVIGRFELADGGTLFLDEIGELPLGLQVKLLRVLQEGEFERVGSARTQRVDVRVIAATNRDLAAAVSQGTFRRDLYFRLNVFPITVPPLRDRRDDIPLLVKHFVDKFAGRIGKKIDQISKRSMERLIDYHWPGNIRELENVIERAVILNHGPILEIEDQLEGRPVRPPQPDRAPTLKEHEQTMIRKALEECQWVIEGTHGAAARLDIPPSTLRDRMRKYGIEKQQEQA